jgi:hypothetical protein
MEETLDSRTPVTGQYELSVPAADILEPTTCGPLILYSDRGQRETLYPQDEGRRSRHLSRLTQLPH